MGYRITWGGNPEDVCVTTWGTASIEGLDAWVEEGLSDSRYRPGMHVLIDHRHLDWSRLSTENVQERVELLARDAVRLDSARAAVVMRSPADFGMARMEQAYIDLEPELGIAIRIFLSIEDAREWLREQIAADAGSAVLTQKKAVATDFGHERARVAACSGTQLDLLALTDLTKAPAARILASAFERLSRGFPEQAPLALAAQSSAPAAARHHGWPKGGADTLASCPSSSTGPRPMSSLPQARLVPHWFYTYFVHVLSGKGYQFWSGIGSDVGEVTLIGLVMVWWRHHNCHVYHCWRLSWHPHPDHKHPVCRHHHPDYKKIHA